MQCSACPPVAEQGWVVTCMAEINLECCADRFLPTACGLANQSQQPTRQSLCMVLEVMDRYLQQSRLAGIANAADYPQQCSSHPNMFLAYSHRDVRLGCQRHPTSQVSKAYTHSQHCYQFKLSLLLASNTAVVRTLPECTCDRTCKITLGKTIS